MGTQFAVNAKKGASTRQRPRTYCLAIGQTDRAKRAVAVRRTGHARNTCIDARASEANRRVERKIFVDQHADIGRYRIAAAVKLAARKIKIGTRMVESRRDAEYNIVAKGV